MIKHSYRINFSRVETLDDVIEVLKAMDPVFTIKQGVDKHFLTIVPANGAEVYVWNCKLRPQYPDRAYSTGKLDELGNLIVIDGYNYGLERYSVENWELV